jgi:pyruvate dehydrogenase E2 component (dihydrolipoamide acetyltransferase)
MDIVMPSLGADMEEGTLVEWKVAVGDSVHKGDIIAVIETQKGAIDMEVYEDGVITALLKQPVVTVPVGVAMATLRTKDETVKPAGRVSPAARKAARELHVDVSALKGSGAGGAVLLSDLQRQTASSASEGMRKSIALAMEKSKREIPHYYLSIDVDISNAQVFIERVNAQREPEQRLLLLALLLRATAKALIDYPQLNGFYKNGVFSAAPDVHIGNAISLRNQGLVVPAIHGVDKLSLDETMTALRDLTARSRSGHLRSSELMDASVTVTNIGDRGADAVFGIIYPPQVSIIGFGRSRQAVVVVDNAIVIRQMITLSLSADHRVSDGILGAKFLNRLATLLQQPDIL